MKRKITFRYHLPTVIVTLLALLNACNDPNNLGMELLPSTDLIEVKNLVEKSSILAYTFQEEGIRTDEASRSLLGSMNDTLFGKTDIDFATQFRLQSFPDYGTNPVADSVKLYLYYRFIYGDTVTPQTFRVYELEESLIADTSSTQGGASDYPYFQDVDLKSMASSQVIGEIQYTPKIELDSASQDTLYQLIVIPLDISLGEKLVYADSLQMVNNDVFLEYFKGLYIEAEKQSEKGSILSLETVSSSSFQGSALVVFYDNDENQAKEKPDTMLYPYLITQFSARVNSIKHDYTGTPFEANLNSELEEDSLLYVQSTGGLESKIFIESLSSWRDSTRMGINKAELIFQIDTIASDLDKYPPPSRLLFTYVGEDGIEYLPADNSFHPSFYGGYLRTDDYTYRFNITQHLQEIIDNNVENLGFYLTTVNKNSEANRVVLKGSGSKTGIRLVITYSEFL
ncbi:DUF4270 domain-containing protein [Mariniphaga sediminis]|uniref:DUF4270 domain-containing protein n=1 Tax=Mariniphaga sediminis TaxID=1628158 RepID=UPI003565E179